MNIENVKLKALANLPFYISDIPVIPVSLRRIAEVGYEAYSQFLSLISIKKEQLINQEHLDKVPDELAVYDIIEMYGQNDPIFSHYISAIRFLAGADNVVLNNGLYINNIRVEKEKFECLVDVIKIQNGISIVNVEEFNPLSEGAKKLKQRILEKRKKVQELKQDSHSGSSDSLTFFDLVSILSSNSNGINIFNVFDLNMFQFNDQFNRMKLLSDYEISIQSLLHGADPKKIEIKHWMSRS